jgi:Protein of Unknown function (DUF2784)
MGAEPRMLYAVAAGLVVVAHVTFIAFVLLGGFLAWRWPRVLWAHVPALVLTAVLFAFGADCPLTDLEKYFRRQAGEDVYRDGFVAHYLVPGVPDGVRGVVLPVLVVTVTAIAYAGCWRRARPSSPAPGAAGTWRRASAPTTRPSRVVRRGS